MSPDYDLLSRIRQKDQSALRQAIHRFSGYVAAVIQKSLGPLGTPQDVEELTSDAFVALWQNADKLRDDSDLKYWLAVVARNASLKRRDTLKREPPLEENLILDSARPEDAAQRQDQVMLVRKAVDSLEPVDREIFLRHYYYAQTVQEISRHMHLNESTVKTKLRRGWMKLKDTLTREGFLLKIWGGRLYGHGQQDRPAR